MSVSENLSQLNHQRYQDFNVPFTPQNAKQALNVLADTLQLLAELLCLHATGGLHGALHHGPLLREGVEIKLNDNCFSLNKRKAEIGIIGESFCGMSV